MNSSINPLLTRIAQWLQHHTRLMLWLMIVGTCSLVASTYHYFRHTWDEPEHMAAGMQLIDKHIYTYDQQHPPVARLAMAIGPYLAGARSFGEPGPSGEQEGRDLLYRTGNYTLLLTLARIGMLPFLVLLMLATWTWARAAYGVATAYVSILLLITTPQILGHAGIAALDVPGAATCTLAFYCMWRWLQSHTWQHALLFALTSGLAVATKLSALPFIAVVAATWSVLSLINVKSQPNPQTTVLRWFGQSFSILVLSLVVAMFAYGYSFKFIVDDAHPNNMALNYLFGYQGQFREVIYVIARHVPMPVGFERLVYSIEALAKHNAEGHLSYLMGEFSKTGFRDFYLVALIVKTPIPLLLLGAAGIVYMIWMYMIRGSRADWVVAAPAMAFVVLLIFCISYSHINIGVRHVFVLYPLMAMAAASLVVTLWQRFNSALLRWALTTLILLQATSLVGSYPDYLPYFNAFAGNHPEKILIDSDLDWGQDLERLENRLHELQVTKFGFVYRGSADVIGEHLPGVWMVQPFNPATGWIAASIYARDTVSQGEAFGWLRKYQPIERIGKSIDLYYIPDAESPANMSGLK
jgi:hypothetical protein